MELLVFSYQLPVLAAATPDAQFLLMSLITLGFLVWLFKTIKETFQKSPSHQELATKEELKSYATKHELTEFKTEIRGDFKTIKAMIKESTEKVDNYAEKSYQGRNKIHERVNTIDRDLSSSKARQEEMSKSIHTLTATKING